MKVVRHDDVTHLIGDNQILAMPLVVPGEQKMRIANREGKLIIRVRTWTEINIKGRKMVDLNRPKLAAVIHDAPKQG